VIDQPRRKGRRKEVRKRERKGVSEKVSGTFFLQKRKGE
jgi:hypothetical protein